MASLVRASALVRKAAACRPRAVRGCRIRVVAAAKRDDDGPADAAADAATPAQVLADAGPRVEATLRAAGVPRLEERLASLQAATEAPNLWDNADDARRAMVAAAAVRAEVEELRGLEARLTALNDALALAAEAAADPETRDDAELLAECDADAADAASALLNALSTREQRDQMTGRWDSRGASIEVRAGAGGEDAQDWRADKIEQVGGRSLAAGPAPLCPTSCSSPPPQGCHAGSDVHGMGPTPCGARGQRGRPESRGPPHWRQECDDRGAQRRGRPRLGLWTPPGRAGSPPPCANQPRQVKRDA